MPEKNIADTIQSMLEKNNGFMTLRKLSLLIGSDGRNTVGIKTSNSGKVIQRKIEQYTEDKFMFLSKGRTTYILVPCEPSELVLRLLSDKKAFNTRTIKTLPFTKTEFFAILNSLMDEGSAKVRFDDKGKPEIFRVKASEKVVSPKAASTESVKGELYSREKFHEAFTALDVLGEGRIFVRIPDLRRRLNWPHEVFDEMIRDLRDDEIIGIYLADESTMTNDEINDCFIDENNFRMGTVTWNAK